MTAFHISSNTFACSADGVGCEVGGSVSVAVCGTGVGLNVGDGWTSVSVAVGFGNGVDGINVGSDRLVGLGSAISVAEEVGCLPPEAAWQARETSKRRKRGIKTRF